LITAVPHLFEKADSHHPVARKKIPTRNNTMSASVMTEEVGVEHFDTEQDYLPSESQLVLLCLDFLRDLRRAYPNQQDLLDAEGLHADWLTLAIYALSRSFSMQGSASARAKSNSSAQPGTFGIPNYNQITMPVFNDAWMDSHRLLAEASPSQQEEMMNPSPTPDMRRLPTIAEMTKHVLYQESPFVDDDDDEEDEGSRGRRPKSSMEEKKEHSSSDLDSYAWYEYDDYHPSNANRFFLLNGVASSLNGRGPLLLAELAAAGLCQMQAKSRRQAEDEMTASPLFEQFVNAVKNKGFFDDPENETRRDDPKDEEERLVLQKAVQDERMAKVISKFRNKLASKVNLEGEGGGMMQLLDYHHNRRMRRIMQSRKLKNLGLGLVQKPVPPQIRTSSMHMRSNLPTGISPMARALPTPTAPGKSVEILEAQALERKAEQLKSRGNAHMQKKEYTAALDCYTQALKVSPSGPQSHVYFSNRAAALLSMKKFDQAILDSERALALLPTYGKAHARLGLAHFLLGDYRHAMEAYTVALKYEPDNKSSQAYLEKAARKLAAAHPEDNMAARGAPGTSFSVVSEWEKSNSKDSGRTRGVRNGGSHSGNGNKMFEYNKPPASYKPSSNGSKPPIATTDKGSEEAEKLKTKGNAHMADREYEKALEAYTTAVELSPNGPQSHVYYSNRAAALCYLERYLEASADSAQALRLKPTYGKAHARLGLARFFLQEYEGAVAAYKAALKYDPDNAASKSYLAKAQAKLKQRRSPDDASYVTEDARRLMDDPDMIYMARKVMESRGKTEEELLLDPEMQKITRRAMADPTMLEAIQSIQHVDRSSVSQSLSSRDE
jgi:tetratricopeptide (TPR) repeat protein